MSKLKKYKYPIILTLISFIILISFQRCGSAGSGGNTAPTNGINSNSLTNVIQMSSECTPNILNNIAGYPKEISCHLEGDKYIQIGADVLINGKRCTNLRVEGNRNFYCLVPPMLAQGVYDVHITNLNLSNFVIKNGITYYDNCTPGNTYQLNAEFNQTLTIPYYCGIQPIIFIKESGQGTLDSVNRQFKAPSEEGVTIISHIDYSGNKHTIEILTHAPPVPPLIVSPSTLSMFPGQSYKLSAQGGKGPYSFALSSNVGTIDNDGNLKLNSNTVATNEIILVKDSENRSAQVNVKINKISINPQDSKISLVNSQLFSIQGGTPPFTLSVNSLDGKINDRTFTPSSIGVKVITVTDANGAQVTTSVDVTETLLANSPTTTKVGDLTSFPITGGVPPYTYSLLSGSVGTIDSNGKFSSTTPGNSTVVVKDSLQNIFNIFVIIQSNLQINFNSSMPSIGNQQFSTSGGMAPYTYKVLQGKDNVSSGGLFTSQWTIQPSIIRVTDALGYTKDFTVNKTASSFVDNYNFSSNYPSIDVNGNIVLNIGLADPQNHLVINKFGEKITTHGAEKRGSVVYPQPDSYSNDCANGGSIRNVSSMNSLSNSYVASEKICYKMIDPNSYTPFKLSNYGLFDYQMKITKPSDQSFFMLNLPEPKSISPNHYQAILVDDEDNIYVIAWGFSRYYQSGQSKTLIWKFNSSGVQQ